MRMAKVVMVVMGVKAVVPQLPPVAVPKPKQPTPTSMLPPPVPKHRGSLASAIDIEAMTPQRQETLEVVRAMKNLDHDLDSKTFIRNFIFFWL